jgi:protein-S-isoprenylcysteine O-methyltransferase Ste14
MRRRLYIRIRSEEEIMLEPFGAAYRQYQRSVSMLIPRWQLPAYARTVPG